MAKAYIEEIKTRLAAATPGPWGWSGCANDRVDVCSKAPGWEGAEIAVVTVDYEFNNRDGLVDGLPVMDRAMAHDNAALIMHAPEDLRALVAEVEMLRGVGCGELREGAEVADGPCGACLKCVRRERDEARADCFRLESERNQAVKDRDASYDALESLRATIRHAHEQKVEATRQRDEARVEIGRLRVENKFLRERPIPEGRIHQAMTGYVMDLRGLVLDHEWVTDGRECLIYCLWCKQLESNGHAETCEMFGPGGLIPIDPKTKRPAPVKSLRERGCQCQWEAGDSACPVHGEEAK